MLLNLGVLFRLAFDTCKIWGVRGEIFYSLIVLKEIMNESLDMINNCTIVSLVKISEKKGRINKITG